MQVFSEHFPKFALILMLIVRTVQTVINVEGDVKIVGLFQIYDTENGDCSTKVRQSSVMASEAVKWYLEGLNKHGQLPFKIGFEGYKTCRLEEKVSDIAVRVMYRSLAKEGIAGIIGPEFSSETEIISPILSSGSREDRVPQVGFSTTAARLGDEEKFPNFIRMVPADNVQVEVMIQSMIQLEWNRVAIIFDDDTYGTEAASLLKTKAKEESICVAMFESISVKHGLVPSEISSLLNDIIIGSDGRPPISGIVFIGSSSTARSVLLILNNAGYSSVPIIMLSEGVNMDTSVFRQFDGQVLSKAQGSLVSAPTYREVIEFSSHWRSVFTNSTYFQIEFASNPWLIDVFYDIKQCDDRNCEFTELTDSEFYALFSEQPLYIQYAILAAHTLVKGVDLLHKELCSDTGSCTSFATEFHSGDILDKLKGISIDMTTDFEWSLESLSADDLQMSINMSGEIQVAQDTPSYQLFNFRALSGLSSDFALVKIADYKNRKLTIDTSKIRDYNNEGPPELKWPDVRKGQCDVPSKCEGCIPIQNLHESVIFESGDLYIIALVPVFDNAGTDGCGDIRKVSGYLTVEAIRFAVEKANTKSGDFANFFGGLKIGLIVLNSCNNPVVTQRKIYELDKNGVTLQNGTVVKLTNKILGYIGDLGSSVSISAAEVLTRLQAAQISFASTSPLLSDRSKYPYFMRIVSPDDAQARAMIGIMQMLKSDYVQIVYSVGAYGEGGKDKMKEIAFDNHICVVQEIAVDETGSPFEIYEQLRRFSHAKIVVIFLRSHRLEAVMSALVSQMSTRGEFIFIGSEAWARRNDPLRNDARHLLLGSFTVSIEIYQDNELKDHVRNLEPKSFNQNPWSLLYLQAKRNCYFDISYDKTMDEKCSSSNDFKSDPNFELDAWDTPAFVAAKCLLTGANAFLNAKCGYDSSVLCEDFTRNIPGLVDEIRKIKLALDGSGNKIKVFNDNGDGNIGYRIYNIQRDTTLQSLDYVEVGRYPLEGTFTFETSKIVNPTEGDFVSTCPNEQACAGCFMEKGVDDTSTSDETLNIGMLVLGVLLAVAVVAVIVLVVVLVRLRKVQYKASQIYLTPMDSQDGGDMKRQEAVGSEEFSVIRPCSPPDTVRTNDSGYATRAF